MKKRSIAIVLLSCCVVFAILLYQKTGTAKVLSNSPISPTLAQSTKEDRILRDITLDGIRCEDNVNGNKVNRCVVEKVVGEYAKGTMPMGYWMAYHINDAWKIIITGNGIPFCSEIDKNNVPRAIFGNCIETSGELRY